MTELGIGITACGVLSRVLLSRHWSRDRRVSGSDYRAHRPRFTGEALGAVDVGLTDQLAARIEREIPSGAIRGTRCDAAGMAVLDSGRWAASAAPGNTNHVVRDSWCDPWPIRPRSLVTCHLQGEYVSAPGRCTTEENAP